MSDISGLNAEITKHLSEAKSDIEAGNGSLRSAAEHVAAALALGATQAEVAAAVGMSQPWVNRLVKWQRSGFTKGGPFGADNAKKKISKTNNNKRVQVINELLRKLSECDALRTYLQESDDHQDIAALVDAADLEKSQLLHGFIVALHNSSLAEAA
jgi:hypothetical protein